MDVSTPLWRQGPLCNATTAISFFVFEFAHYIVDVHRGAAPIRDPLHFGIFALFYPRLAAGPIVRFHQIIPQLEALAPPRQSDIVIGLGRIIGGVAKKFLIAGHLVRLAGRALSPARVIAIPAGPRLWAVVVGKGLGWLGTQAAVMAAWLPFFHPVGEVRLIVLHAFHG